MKINIPTTQGPRPTTAYRSGVPGIVVSKRVANLGWMLTHSASGLAVSGATYRTIADAKAAAALISDLADWTTDVRETADLRSLGQRVVAALRGEPAPRESIVEGVLPAGWELQGDDLDGLLICPCGHTIEMDGRCPDGCVSPLRTAGLI